MISFILRRLAFTLLTVLGAITVTFMLATLVPSDPARAALGPDATESQIANYRRERGLDQPVPVQYVRYMEAMIKGDLGTSIVSRTPVVSDLARFIPATIELLVPSVLISILFGVALGVAAAFYRNTWVDAYSG